MPPLEIQIFSPSMTNCVAVAAGGATHRRDIRSGLRLGQSEGRDQLAPGDRGQDPLLQFGCAGEADRAGAKSLHGEGEVGEAVGIGQRLADEAERTAVDDLGGAAKRLRNAIAQEAGRAEAFHQPLAGRVGIRMVDRSKAAVGNEAVELGREAPMRLVKERPVQVIPAWPARRVRAMRRHAVSSP